MKVPVPIDGMGIRPVSCPVSSTACQSSPVAALTTKYRVPSGARPICALRLYFVLDGSSPTRGPRPVHLRGGLPPMFGERHEAAMVVTFSFIVAAALRCGQSAFSFPVAICDSQTSARRLHAVLASPRLVTCNSPGQLRFRHFHSARPQGRGSRRCPASCRHVRPVLPPAPAVQVPGLVESSPLSRIRSH